MSLQHSFADYYHQAVSFLFSSRPPLTKTGYSSSGDNNPIRNFLWGAGWWSGAGLGFGPCWEASVKGELLHAPPEPDPQQLLDAP